MLFLFQAFGRFKGIMLFLFQAFGRFKGTITLSLSPFVRRDHSGVCLIKLAATSHYKTRTFSRQRRADLDERWVRGGGGGGCSVLDIPHHNPTPPPHPSLRMAGRMNE
jgi:hypothetical protein